MVECENPYRWYNYIKPLIEQYDTIMGKTISLIDD